MKTILDDGYSWFLEKISYHENLQLELVEALLGGPENLKIDDVSLGEVNRIETSPKSRVVKVNFEDIIAWQCLDESYTAHDDYEKSDDTGYIQIITRSKYLDYVNDNHGWYPITRNAEGKHYRVWTEDEVVDVVTLGEPEIALKHPGNLSTKRSLEGT